jgi:hypothetical protein
LTRCFITIHLGHLYIQENEVVWLALERLDHLQAVAHYVRSVTEFLEEAPADDAAAAAPCRALRTR